VIFSNFNKSIFFVVTIILGLLTFVAFIAAFAADEGTIGNTQIWHILANLFSILRFPTHTLMWKLFSEGGAGIYYGGLVFNCLFYSFLIERLFYFLSKNTGLQQDKLSKLISENGFHIESKGRAGTIYYVENKKVLKIDLEVSGVPQFDILVYFDNIVSWTLPVAQELTNKEKSEIRIKLIDWLHKKKIRAEI